MLPATQQAEHAPCPSQRHSTTPNFSRSKIMLPPRRDAMGDPGHSSRNKLGGKGDAAYGTSVRLRPVAHHHQLAQPKSWHWWYHLSHLLAPAVLTRYIQTANAVRRTPELNIQLSFFLKQVFHSHLKQPRKATHWFHKCEIKTSPQSTMLLLETSKHREGEVCTSARERKHSLLSS